MSLFENKISYLASSYKSHINQCYNRRESHVDSRIEFCSAMELANLVGHLYKDDKIIEIVGAVNCFNLGLYYADSKEVNENFFLLGQ